MKVAPEKKYKPMPQNTKPPEKIDRIELRRANLAMRASVAEEGLSLTGQNSLAWAHFLQRTWRDMEDFYWSKSHAA